MRKWLGLATFLVGIALVTGAISAQDSDKFGTVSGTVTYLQKIALPDGAEVVINLTDLTQADSPKVIGSQTIIPNGRQVPFDYSLSYETASIQKEGTYIVSARIEVGGVADWVSDPYPVFTNGEQTADIVLVPVTAAEATEAATMTTGNSMIFGTVTGTVFYTQRIALPDNAVVQVQLQDVSQADAPAFVLASQQFITNGRQVPYSFSLNYDTNGIGNKGRYTVRAMIYVGGALQWTSDTSNPVISNGVYNVDVQVKQVSS